MVGVSPGAQIADRLAGFALRRIHKRGNTVFFPKYSKPFPWFLCAFFACGLWCVKLFFRWKTCVWRGTRLKYETEYWNVQHGYLKESSSLDWSHQDRAGQFIFPFDVVSLFPFFSFPVWKTLPNFTRHTFFLPKMRWNVPSPSLDNIFKEEGGIFSLARNSMFNFA